MTEVGFIGVGIMGGAIARRLIEQDVNVLAYDIDSNALEKIHEAGGETADSVSQVVDHREIVFACLPNEEISRAVACGSDGVVSGKKVRYYIETSTLGASSIASIAHGLADRNIAVLDSPVIGGVIALEAGSLGVLVAGEPQAYDAVTPILEKFAGKLFYLGSEPGAAQVGKVINNAVAYANLYATFEAVAVGLKAGVDMTVLVDLINSGSGANFATQMVFPNYILKNKFEGTGPVSVGDKDVKLFLEEAKNLGARSPVAEKISQIASDIVNRAGPSEDTMTGFFHFCELAGVDLDRFTGEQ